MTAIDKRYDFVLLFDVQDGNPNGDPDAGNLPRMDPETGQGLVTDVCLKRKIRNYVELSELGDKHKIFIREKAILNRVMAESAETAGIKLEKEKIPAKERDNAKDYMCKHFYDVRSFGAVMSTGPNAGQVRGPVQLTFARSTNPVFAQEHSITRMAVATEKEAEKQEGDNRTMGRKFTVPYGLYRAHGFVSAPLAQQTGFSEQDLELLWQSLMNMFEHDRSAARGQMATRGLYVFEHDNRLGTAPAHKLFERIKVHQNEGVEVARKFEDFTVEVSSADLPSGVKLHEKLN